MASYLIPVTADGGFSQTPVAGSPAIEFATEEYVGTAIANLVDTAPTTLDTLNELAAALGDDANYAATVTTALGNKADSSSLATVATSGSYTDLSNKPTIPSNTNQLTNGAGFLTSVGTISYTDLSNKPTIPTNTNQLTNGAGFLVASDISGKQATLVSGTNIRTVNGTSILGSGDIGITATSLLPSQVSNSGKYLTTNGAGTLSWATVSGGSGSGPTNYFKGLQILEDVYEASGAANIIFESTDSSVTITRNANALDFTVAGSGGAPTYEYNDAISLGYSTGSGTGRILLGNLAGNAGTSQYSIAIGHIAGQSNQGDATVAIGQGAGYSQQGNFAIAIGYNAGWSSQNANSIVLNASGDTLDTNQSGFFVKPVRSDATPTNIIYYNSITGEMTYGAAPSGSSGGGGSGSGGEDPTAFSISSGPVGPLYGTDYPWTPPAKTGAMIAILSSATWVNIWTASLNGTTQKSPRPGSNISPPWASAWYGTVSGPQNGTTQSDQGGGYGSYQCYSLDSSTNPATDEMAVGFIMANFDSNTGIISVSNVYSSLNWSPTSPGYLYGYISINTQPGEAITGFTGEAGVTWKVDIADNRVHVIVPPSVWAAGSGTGGPIGTLTGTFTPGNYYSSVLGGLIFGV